MSLPPFLTVSPNSDCVTPGDKQRIYHRGRLFEQVHQSGRPACTSLPPVSTGSGLYAGRLSSTGYHWAGKKGVRQLSKQSCRDTWIEGSDTRYPPRDIYICWSWIVYCKGHLAALRLRVPLRQGSVVVVLLERLRTERLLLLVTATLRCPLMGRSRANDSTMLNCGSRIVVAVFRQVLIWDV